MNLTDGSQVSTASTTFFVHYVVDALTHCPGSALGVGRNLYRQRFFTASTNLSSPFALSWLHLGSLFSVRLGCFHPASRPCLEFDREQGRV